MFAKDLFSLLGKKKCVIEYTQVSFIISGQVEDGLI